jgi:hypothetical protein
MSHCGVAWVGEWLGERNSQLELGRARAHRYPACGVFPLDEAALESMTRLPGALGSCLEIHGAAAGAPALMRLNGLAA